MWTREHGKIGLTCNISLGNNLGRQRPHEERQEVTMSDWEKLYKEAILETDWSKIEDVSRQRIPQSVHDYTNFPSTTVARQKKIN
jgi:hypothetical protein